MPSCFNEYLEALKPKLDEAFRCQVSFFMGRLGLSERTPLQASLDGGKKIRGGLLCMISDALGGAMESALPRAVAVELIQAATLIHDDFVDQDTMRRRMPAVWTLEGARRAVLLGDVLFATAIKMMNELSRQDGLVVSQAIAEISTGAFHEPLDPLPLVEALESDKLNGALYEKIIRLKTGILFGAACQMGAIAAGAREERAESAFRYGVRIGEAYQIADDLKEVKGHLWSKSLPPKQAAALVPAFLYFREDMRPCLGPLLSNPNKSLTDGVLRHLREAVGLMEEEIERRLKRALFEIETHFPENDYRELTRRTPWDLIRMFDAAS